MKTKYFSISKCKYCARQTLVRSRTKDCFHDVSIIAQFWLVPETD